jgi:Cupin-like domain
MKNVLSINNADPNIFQQEIRSAGQPVLMKGLVATWPIVAAARQGDEALASSMSLNASDVPLTYALGGPEIEGRFHYTDDLQHLNFVRKQTTLRSFLELLLAERKSPTGQAFGMFILCLYCRLRLCRACGFAMQPRSPRTMTNWKISPA